MKIRIKILLLTFSCLGFMHLQAEEVEMPAACQRASSRGRFAAVGLSDKEIKSLKAECCDLSKDYYNDFYNTSEKAMNALHCSRS